jgi:hypothetical protein
MARGFDTTSGVDANVRSARRPVVTAILRHALGRAEDEAVASGWRWDANLSHRVDRLLVLIEAVGT